MLMFKRWSNFLLIIAISAYAVSNAHAGTDRKAKVSIFNKTDKEIVFARVVHKYSNKRRDDLIWQAPRTSIKPGKGKFADKAGQRYARYITGALTTGKDWWFVTWIYKGDDKIYYSNPNNFRGAIDVLEKVTHIAAPLAVDAAAAAAAAGCTVATGGGCAPVALVGTAGAIYGSGKLADALFNGESTKGFKQHILRKSDDGEKVRIYILPNGKMKIRSPSGTSKTVYSSKKAELNSTTRQTLMRAVSDEVNKK